MTVFVVLWDNYGDQGVDFIGTYSTRAAAEQAIANREPTNLNERTTYSIVESEVREDGSIPEKSWLGN